jgi:glucose-6-phosphate 1-dehydrogenase
LSIETVRDERVQVLRGIPPLQSKDVVRGQFGGYRSEVGVKTDSQVETYVALRFYINSWRWQGMPFYIRAGKSLQITATEIIVTLRPPPDIFLENPLPANYVRFRVTPDLVIAIGSHVKVPGDGLLGQQVELVVSSCSDPREVQAYEELLGDALAGNSSRFARQDYVEEAWRIVDPVLDNATPVFEYSPGTWGPVEADALAHLRVDQSHVRSRLRSLWSFRAVRHSSILRGLPRKPTVWARDRHLVATWRWNT